MCQEESFRMHYYHHGKNNLTLLGICKQNEKSIQRSFNNKQYFNRRDSKLENYLMFVQQQTIFQVTILVSKS